MNTLSIDIETFSSVDIKKSGAYKYIESPDFQILLFSYSWNFGPVHTLEANTDFAFEMDDDELELTGGYRLELPDFIIDWLQDESVIKTAWNATFERLALSKYLRTKLPASQWRCTAILSASLGFPLGLDVAATVLNVEDKKDKKGKDLIRYFSVPCKPGKSNGGRTRNLPHHNPEKWVAYKKYNADDVAAEMAVLKKLSFKPLSDAEQRLYMLDQKINDTGVLVDKQLAQNAIRISEAYNARLIEEAKQLTGLDNPNSVAQLIDWLNSSEEVEGAVMNLRKDTVKDLLKSGIASGVGERVLEIRQELAKSSIKKYNAILRTVCSDGRVHGMTQFYGALRTRRWAGRFVQLQNLPKNHIGFTYKGKYYDQTEEARQLVLNNDLDGLEFIFGDVPSILSQLIRTTFKAPSGSILAPSDFSAIEARVLAWIAREKWRIDVFNTHGKIYEASAATMFKLPIESIGKSSPERQKGKVAELALGYQGGANALVQMGALDMGLKPEELDPLVKAWRAANPNIVKFWYAVQDGAISTVKNGTSWNYLINKNDLKGPAIRMKLQKGALIVTLPSGGDLVYPRIKLIPGKFGEQLCYEGLNDKNKWSRITTYGGKLTENIVQAIARDLLAEAMLRLDAAGYNIVFHVHDEAVSERPLNFGSVEEVTDIMRMAPAWASGLPLNADSYETPYYRKDD